MLNVTLTFYERIHIWNILGNHQIQNLREASTFLRLIEKCRPSDEELRETEFLSEAGQYRWVLPVPDYGTKCLELEDEEAKSLAGAVEVAPGIKVRDAGWLMRLVEQCSVSRKETTDGVVHR